MIVKDTFDDSADYDVMFPASALVLRVPALGKNGLNNGGEPLILRDMANNVHSKFPAKPKPQSGLSVVRRTPQTTADEADGFAVAEPTPGAVNARD